MTQTFLRFLVGVLALFWINTGTAFALPYKAPHAEVELVADSLVATPGSTIRAALVMDLEPGWHVYWENAGDSGLPPEILWSEKSGAETAGFQWPLPNLQPIETLMNYGFEDRLVLPFQVTLPDTPSGLVRLEGSADYLICKDICIPEAAPVGVSIELGESAVPADLTDEMFAWADSRLPLRLGGSARIDRSGENWTLSVADSSVRAALDAGISKIRFFPLDHQIEHYPEQSAKVGAKGVSLSLTPADLREPSAGDLSGVLVVEDTDGNRVGFEIDAEPGDILPGTDEAELTLASGSVKAGEGAASLTLTGLLGILAAALLGGAILNLMPCVLPVLFIKARSFLALAGHDDDGHIRQHGMFYLMGVLLCFLGFGVVLIVLRAGGEQIGLGFQLQIPVVVALLALLMFVLALNMMGMFDMGSSLMGVGAGLADKGGAIGAFFTGVLAAFVGAPCIGPFIGGATAVLISQPVPVILLVFLFLGLGMALPFAALSFFPGLFRLLPKPGPWMERLKQFFAFPLFLTVIWLVSVLGSQLGVTAVVVLGVAATAITFGIWLLNARPETGVFRAIVTAISVLAILGGVLLPVLSFREGESAESGAEHVSLEGYGEAWSPERVAELRAEGRPVFVDFTASWCVTCLVNKSTTLTTKKVQDAFEAHNVAFLVADWSRRDKLIGAELARHERAGVPLYLYYSPGKTDPVILPQVLSADIVVKSLEE